MKNKKKIASILLAAGSSQRLESSVPKPYRALVGKPLIFAAAQSLAPFGAIQPVIRLADEALYHKAFENTDLPLLPPVEGGKTRAASVLVGLEALKEENVDIVLIHDSARPFFPAGTIEALLEALHEGFDGAAPALPMSDNLKEIKGDQVAQFAHPKLMRTQTPQAFNYQRLIEAFEGASLDERDELAVLEKIAGSKVKLVLGDHRNIKITYPKDLEAFTLTRTGLGVDSHSFCAGDFIMLGGVKVPHAFGIAAHSDGDVVLHALCDSIFGALAQQDLGHHFPGTDEWKDAPSSKMLKKALNLMEKENFILNNIDITIICQAPKIAPHREAIRESLASLLAVPHSAISVKATTTDGLGLIGEGKGCAAVASVLLRANNV